MNEGYAESKKKVEKGVKKRCEIVEKGVEKGVERCEIAKKGVKSLR